MTNTHKFINSEGCCVCGIKHSTSQFRAWHEHHDESVYCQVFGLDTWEGRRGKICNPCHLFIKRALRSMGKGAGSQGNKKRLDSKWKGSLPRIIKERLPTYQPESSGRTLISGRHARRLIGPLAYRRVPRYAFTSKTSVPMVAQTFTRDLRQTGPVSDLLDENSERLYRWDTVEKSDGDDGSSVGAVGAQLSRFKIEKRKRGDSEEDRQPSKRRCCDSDVSDGGEASRPQPRKNRRVIRPPMRRRLMNRRCARPPVRNLKLKNVGVFDPTYFRIFGRCCITYRYGEGDNFYATPHHDFGNCPQCGQGEQQRLFQMLPLLFPQQLSGPASQKTSSQELSRPSSQELSRPSSQELSRPSSQQLSMQQQIQNFLNSGSGSELESVGVSMLADQEGALSVESSDDDINETRTTDSPLSEMQLPPFIMGGPIRSKLGTDCMEND